MKNKINSTVILLSMAIGFIACGGSDTPRSVAEKFLKSMSTEDFEAAKKYGTDETEKLLDMMTAFKKMSADSTKKEFKFEITHESIEGEKATIYYKEEGKPGELQLPMVKVDGKWKVLLNKESINSSDGVSAIDAGATSTDTAR